MDRVAHVWHKSEGRVVLVSTRKAYRMSRSIVPPVLNLALNACEWAVPTEL